MKLKNLISAVLLFSSVSSFGAGYLTNLTSGGVKIKSYFTHSGGGVTLMLESNTPKNPDECTVTDRVHLKANNTDGHKHMVAAALTAFASNKKVGLWSPGCESIPFWGGGIQTPIVTNLWVFNQ